MKSTVQPEPSNPQPVNPSRWQRRLLGVAITMEAVWILLLLAMTLAR
jgi:hypothetical protein